MRLSCESLVVRGMCWHHWFCFQVRDSNELAAEEKTFLNFTVPVSVLLFQTLHLTC